MEGRTTGLAETGAGGKWGCQSGRRVGGSAGEENGDGEAEEVGDEVMDAGSREEVETGEEEKDRRGDWREVEAIFSMIKDSSKMRVKICLSRVILDPFWRDTGVEGGTGLLSTSTGMATGPRVTK